ncbi:hypothetical protein AB0C96_42135 [Streptomyces sp. NPDC048506]|uniref:WD40 repeat domain-containing protein n=1 Tax=Streptomyces sp. NPDC048506 TaxID=3155028 RepID=UPI0034207612
MPIGLSTLPDKRVAPRWVAFRPGGDVLVTGHADGAARLWNVHDPRHPRLLATLPGHTGMVTSAAFGRTAARWREPAAPRPGCGTSPTPRIRVCSTCCAAIATR